MGIDLYTLRYIKAVAEEHDLTGRALMLGRQGVNRAKERPRVRELARGLGVQGKLNSKFDMVDGVMAAIGFSAVDALDISDYQGAEVLQDLSAPVPVELYDSYDLIYDGGTTEHVFNLPVAFENVEKMLSDGGVFVSANLLNGDPTHGLYQFGPDLVYSYWGRSRGLEVLCCVALPIDDEDNFPAVDIPDIGATGKRFPLTKRLPKGSSYLFYAVRKSGAMHADGPVYQSDYATRWSERGTQDRRSQA